MSWFSKIISNLFSKSVVEQIEHFGQEILKYFIPDVAQIVQDAAKKAIAAADANGGDWLNKLKFASDSLVAQFPDISRAVLNSAIHDVYLAGHTSAPLVAPTATLIGSATESLTK